MINLENLRKILSVLLIICMVCSVSAPSFADSTVAGNQPQDTIQIEQVDATDLSKEITEMELQKKEATVEGGREQTLQEELEAAIAEISDVQLVYGKDVDATAAMEAVLAEKKNEDIKVRFISAENEGDDKTIYIGEDGKIQNWHSEFNSNLKSAKVNVTYEFSLKNEKKEIVKTLIVPFYEEKVIQEMKSKDAELLTEIPCQAFEENSSEELFKATLINGESLVVKEIGRYHKTGKTFIIEVPYGVTSINIRPDESLMSSNPRIWNSYTRTSQQAKDGIYNIPLNIAEEDLVNDITFTSNGIFRCAKNEGFDYFDESEKSKIFLNEGITLPRKNVQGFNLLLKRNPNMALIIQQSTVPSENIDKESEARKELRNLIKNITDNEDKYYHEGDRYNGRENDTITDKESGFWKHLTEFLDKATQISKDNTITDEYIKETTQKLKAEIDKLIPVENINVTELYEEIQEIKNLVWGTDDEKVPGHSINAAVKRLPKNDNRSGVLEASVTANTWAVYQKELKESQQLLDSLYDENGEESEINISGSETEKDCNLAIDKLKESVSGLDYRLISQKCGGEVDLSDAKKAYQGIKQLIREYDPQQLDTSVYDAESIANYRPIYETATTFFNTHPPVDDNCGEYEGWSWRIAYKNLWNGCNQTLTTAKSPITVNLTVTDNYAARKGIKPKSEVGTYKVTLTEGKTLEDAVKATGISGVYMAAEGRDYCGIGIYVNETFLYEPGKSYNAEPQTVPAVEDFYNKVQLKDNDSVIIAIMDMSTYTNLSDATFKESMKKVARKIKRQVNSVSNMDVQAGTPFEFKVTALEAVPSEYTGVRKPLSGATVFASIPCETEAEARRAAPVDKTTIITDAEGKATVTLYQEGWYALLVQDMLGTGGLSNGENIYVHVSPSNDIDAVKATLLKELKDVYDLYPDRDFRPEDWSTIKEAYEKGVLDINGAEDTGTARAAQMSAIKIIQRVQKATDTENEEVIDIFRWLLHKLPDDIEKLDKSAESTVNSLIDKYTKMSDFQKSQLTGLEKCKYESILEANEKGLPEAVKYKLTTKVQGDCEEATRCLEKLTRWLQDNTGTEDSSGDAYGKKIRGFGTYTLDREKDQKVSKEQNEMEAGNKLNVFTDITYTSYIQLRDNDNHVIEAEDGSWKLTHEEFTLSENTAGQATIYLKVGGEYIKYALDNVSFEGVEVDDSAPFTANLLDCSSYLGRDTKKLGLLNVQFSNAEYIFDMPFDDVCTTLKFTPVNEAGKLKDAKEAAQKAVEDAYNSYAQEKYTEENWEKLTDIKNKALVNIENATNNSEVAEARKAALADMEAVGIKAETVPVPTPVPDVPSFGKSVGRVFVSVENNTFKGGDFKGTIVKGKYDLCEDDTMMTVILKALAADGYSWKGTGAKKEDPFSISYLASINKGDKKLGEFSGDPGSGWMGTLNDWFVNEGFNCFSVKDSELENGDEVKVMFTQNLGEDIGGSWGNSNTSLTELKISGGELMPKFSSDTTNYGLIVSDSGASLTVTPTAANKNYLVKTFLNDYNKDSAFFKRTEKIPVKSEDTLYIGVGEKGWPSMNSQGAEAREYKATKYTVNIYGSKGEYLKKAIADLPEGKKLKLDSKSLVEDLRKSYESLSSKEKEKVTNLELLKKAEERIKFLEEIQYVKKLLEAIPYVSKIKLSDKGAVMKADEAYKVLTAEQKLYITIGDVENYNAAIDKLAELGAFTSGGKPSKIKGSEKAPEDIIEKVSDKEYTVHEILSVLAKTDANGKVTADISAKDISNTLNKALQEVKKAEEKGNKNVILQIEIAVKSDEKVSFVETIIPKNSINDIVKNKGILIISTAIGSTKFDGEALSELAKQASGNNIRLCIEKIDHNKEVLITKHPSLKSRTVFNLSVISDKKEISDLKKGKVIISLPYVIGKNENESLLKLVRLDENGILDTIKESKYNADKKTVDGKTNHFSYYTIVQALAFDDVKSNDWFYGSVMYLADNNIVKGITENTFGPKNSITRAEFVQILYNKNGNPEVSADSNFADVKNSDWYAKAVIWAAEQGIVTGSVNANNAAIFNPNQKISRQDMAVILSNYIEKIEKKSLKAENEKINFLDNTTISSYAKTSIVKMQTGGIIKGVKGKEGYNFNPKNNATRAEAASMLAKLFQTI